MYNSILLQVEPVPIKGLTDIAQLSPEDEQDLKRTLEGKSGGAGVGMRIENTARGKVGGKNALFIGGHRDLPGREETFRHRLCLIVHEGRLYTFDFSTDIESFPTASRAFERLLASVQWGKPTVPAPNPSSSSSTVTEAVQ